MANALYDFGAEDSRIRPFIGVGVGLSSTLTAFGGKLQGVGSDDIADYRRVSGTGRVSYSIPGERFIAGDSDDMAFAWQLLAGGSYRMNSRAHLDLSYRYYNIREVEFSSYNAPGGAPLVGDFKASPADHSITLGIRWAFGD